MPLLKLYSLNTKRGFLSLVVAQPRSFRFLLVHLQLYDSEVIIPVQFNATCHLEKR